MSKQIDLNKYADFVFAVCSMDSKDIDSFIARLKELNEHEIVNVPLLATAATGLGSEGGEFQEIVKKILFQGKPLNEDNIFHMKRELGDIMWYVAQACLALDVSFEEIAQMSFEKLSARYPEGAFTIERSENRVANDI